MIGEILGHYRILEKLGAGGMGDVYLAVDHQLDRRVALKILPQSMAEDRERLERFRREAKALACLDHPNIITIHSVETVTDYHFLVMELLEGETLGDFIPKHGVSLAQFLELSTPLADALAAAHEKGIIHRDLKPSNIVITARQRVKVLDFGLARLKPPEEDTADSEDTTEPLTGHGRLMGTIPYMSPEQLKGSRGDSRSDIFSLGIILYQMATGKRPLRGVNAIEVQSAILRDKPVPIDRIRRDMPHHVARLIGMCLHKNPDHRMQSAKDLRNELIDLKLELTTQDRLPPPPDAERPRKQRNLMVVVMTLTIIVALVGVFKSGTVPMPGSTNTPISQPRNVKVQSLLDQAHLAELRGDAKEDLDRAEQSYRAALEIEPLEPAVLGRLALLLSRVQPIYPDSDRPAEIHNLADYALLRDPDNLAALLALGNLAIMDDQLATAEEIAATLVDRHPGAWAGHTLLGRVRIKQNRIEGGLSELRKGASLSGTDNGARLHLAYALWQQGSFHEAASVYEEALRYSPDSSTALVNLATMYGEQGQCLEAIPIFRKLLQISLDTYAALNLATCYYHLDRLEEAIATFANVLEIEPHNPWAHLGMGEAYEKLDEPIQTRSCFEKSIEGFDREMAITGPGPRYLGNRALLAAKLGREQEALDNIHEAERLDPDSGVLFFFAAQVYDLIGTREAAYEYMERSLRAGYSRQKFKNSSVFADNRNDPEFRRLIEADYER